MAVKKNEMVLSAHNYTSCAAVERIAMELTREQQLDKLLEAYSHHYNVFRDVLNNQLRVHRNVPVLLG